MFAKKIALLTAAVMAMAGCTAPSMPPDSSNTPASGPVLDSATRSRLVQELSAVPINQSLVNGAGPRQADTNRITYLLSELHSVWATYLSQGMPNLQAWQSAGVQAIEPRDGLLAGICDPNDMPVETTELTYCRAAANLGSFGVVLEPDGFNISLSGMSNPWLVAAVVAAYAYTRHIEALMDDAHIGWPRSDQFRWCEAGMSLAALRTTLRINGDTEGELAIQALAVSKTSDGLTTAMRAAALAAGIARSVNACPEA